MDRAKLTVPRFLADAVGEVPDHPFVMWEGRPVSYAEFDRLSNRAARMWTGMGIGHGDRVAFLLDNSLEFLVAWFGLAKIGAILVAVNTRFQGEEAAYLVRHSGATVALLDDDRADLVAELRSAHDLLPTAITTGSDGRFENYKQRLEPYGDESLDDLVVGDDVISLIYTSGTTGLPKAVMQTHANFVLTGQSYPSWLRMTGADRIYVCLPLFHINSQAYSTMGTIGARATMVLVPRFSASRFWPDVRRHGVTMFNFIGAMLMILAKSDPTPDDADHRVRVGYSGSVGSLTVGKRRQLEQRYGMKLITGFGMSETTFGFIEPYDAEPRQGTIGKPRNHPDPAVPRSQARVVREDGTDADLRETGELFLRNAAMAKGYFNDPERTAEAFADGWLRTGDLAYRDEDGFFYFVDRKKDIIRRRGENVSSTEVERVLAAHPSVKHVAVIGVRSEMTEEDVLAFVVPTGAPPQPEELWQWAEERLASFKIPRYIEFTANLPRTSTQKVSKEVLRERAHASGTGVRHDREQER